LADQILGKLKPSEWAPTDAETGRSYAGRDGEVAKYDVTVCDGEVDTPSIQSDVVFAVEVNGLFQMSHRSINQRCDGADGEDNSNIST